MVLLQTSRSSRVFLCIFCLMLLLNHPCLSHLIHSLSQRCCCKFTPQLASESVHFLTIPPAPRPILPSLFSCRVPHGSSCALQGVVIIQVRSLAAPAAGPFLRPPPAQLDVLEVERAFASGQGAVVGITDYVLRRLRAFQADAGGEGVVLLEVPRTAFEGMAAEAPVSAAVLQSILLRDACLSEVYAYEVLERSSRA
jgi:hypothetical protein